jgi:hypothetical protein
MMQCLFRCFEVVELLIEDLYMDRTITWRELKRMIEACYNGINGRVNRVLTCRGRWYVCSVVKKTWRI